jgi:hypothetical protein
LNVISGGFVGGGQLLLLIRFSAVLNDDEDRWQDSNLH